MTHVETLPRLAILGVISGFFSGMLIVSFRKLIELPQHFLLPDNLQDNFEAMPMWLYIVLPLAGAFLLGLAFEGLPPHLRKVGVLHVMDRLSMLWCNISLAHGLSYSGYLWDAKAQLFIWVPP